MEDEEVEGKECVVDKLGYVFHAPLVEEEGLWIHVMEVDDVNQKLVDVMQSRKDSPQKHGSTYRIEGWVDDASGLVVILLFRSLKGRIKTRHACHSRSSIGSIAVVGGLIGTWSTDRHPCHVAISSCQSVACQWRWFSCVAVPEHFFLRLLSLIASLSRCRCFFS